MEEQNVGRCVAIVFFQQFYLDREKDIVVDLYMEGERMHYIMRTPNHHTGNLIRNLANLFDLAATQDESGLLVIRGEVPCYFDGGNRRMYILRLGGTKVANIFPDGSVELKASIPAISKTLMSQTKDYRLGVEKTLVKTYIRSECKFLSLLLYKKAWPALYAGTARTPGNSAGKGGTGAGRSSDDREASGAANR